MQSVGSIARIYVASVSFKLKHVLFSTLNERGLGGGIYIYTNNIYIYNIKYMYASSSGLGTSSWPSGNLVPAGQRASSLGI